MVNGWAPSASGPPLCGPASGGSAGRDVNRVRQAVVTHMVVAPGSLWGRAVMVMIRCGPWRCVFVFMIGLGGVGP